MSSQKCHIDNTRSKWIMSWASWIIFCCEISFFAKAQSHEPIVEVHYAGNQQGGWLYNYNRWVVKEARVKAALGFHGRTWSRVWWNLSCRLSKAKSYFSRLPLFIWRAWHTRSPSWLTQSAGWTFNIESSLCSLSPMCATLVSYMLWATWRAPRCLYLSQWFRVFFFFFG